MANYEDRQAREGPDYEDRRAREEEDPVKVSEGLGGVTGGALGVGLGALLGPAGMLLGGLAGAAGGWWAGRGFAHVSDDLEAETHDEHFRRLHETQYADRCTYDEAQGFYRFGRLASHNPDYAGRPFEDVEPELRRGWQGEGAGRFRTWEDVRPFVSSGYGYGRR